MKKHAQFIISGRVQGVMYRDFAKRIAERLHIDGEVENLADGTVRVEAEGEESALNDFEKELRKGPFFSKVVDVKREDSKNIKNYSEFKIVYKNFLDRF